MVSIPARLAVIGYGEQRPLKANDTAEGRNANRRVVVVILSTELMRQSTDPTKLSDSNTVPQPPEALQPAPGHPGADMPSRKHGPPRRQAARRHRLRPPTRRKPSRAAPVSPAEPAAAPSAAQATRR